MSVRPWERVFAATVQAAPLIGLPVWFWQWTVHDNDYNGLFVMFVPGLFMLGAGLAAALAGRIAAIRGTEFMRAQATGSLRFHTIVSALVVLLAIVLTILVVMSSLQWTGTTGNGPPNLEASLGIGVMAYGFVLTLIEIGRVAFGLSEAFS